MATLASDIIQRAYRSINLIPMGSAPTADQLTEGLDNLNSILLSTVGNEAGDDLTDIHIGGPVDESILVSEFVPINVRLVLNLTEATAFNLHPTPPEGARLAITDAAGDLSGTTLTLNANGNVIEYDDPVLLDEDSMTAQWIYRSDESNWMKISVLDSTDFIPFPDEFNDYFILMLATRLSPSYGQSLPPESVMALKRARNQLIARYAPTRQIRSDLDTRNFLVSSTRYYSVDPDSFNKGGIWPWR